MIFYEKVDGVKQWYSANVWLFQTIPNQDLFHTIWGAAVRKVVLTRARPVPTVYKHRGQE